MQSALLQASFWQERKKEELVTILESNAYAQLISHVRQIDANAFITVSNVNEVVGVWSPGCFCL